jgi:hypothetical protein
MSVQSDLLMPALIFFTLAAVLWRYKKMPRAIALLAGAAVFFAWFAFSGLPAALVAKATTSTYWLVGLLAALILGGGALIFETLLSHKYHPVGTPLLMTVFAIAAGTTYAAWPQIKQSGMAMLPKAGVAIQRDITQIRATQASHAATTAASGHQATVLLSAAAIVIVVAFLGLHRLHSRRGGVRRPAAIMNGGGGMLRRGVFAGILGSKSGKAHRGSPPGIGNFGGGNAPVPTGRRP